MSQKDATKELHTVAGEHVQHDEHAVPTEGRDTNRKENLNDQFQKQSKQHSTHYDYHADNPQWHQRPRSPGLKWYKEYDTPESRKCGRVLLIDYVKQGHSKKGMRKVASQEINSIDGLRKLYSNPERREEAVLRVFHVQNAFWATRFLARKFNIKDHDDIVGTDFGRYVMKKKPERRGGRPYLNGRSWKTAHDPWRGISRTSFGVDYLKHYPQEGPRARTQVDEPGKMMELNCYDEEGNPISAYDVYVQRLSCYVQHKEATSEIPGYPDIENPYRERPDTDDPHEYVPHLGDLDNDNTIIIFENSQSGSIEDTAIGARQQWESRWRRLPFYLAYESHDISNDESMALECMKIVLQDVWKSITDNWERFLDRCNDHVSTLEDKIYEQPADETRAPELWTNASMWLKVERIMSIQISVVRETQANLQELGTEPGVENNWLESTPEDMDKLSNLLQEDLVKPTSNLSDLMYQQVSIRDSRHSLQLNLSLWRLSWITFIFLPLTFTVSFFGMNVDTFSGNPSIKWFFAGVIPLMVIVFIAWYITKHALARRRQTPYQRGLYEHLFHDLANEYPRLWSQGGPRDYVRPSSSLDRVKWRLVLYWNRADKTTKGGSEDGGDGYDDLGAWARCKRMLTRRWTSQIRRLDGMFDSSSSLEEGEGEGDETSPLRNGLGGITELVALPATEHAENLPGGMLQVPMTSVPYSAQSIGVRPISRARNSSKGSSAERSSTVMVEEERPSWLKDLSERRRSLAGWVESISPPRSERRSEDSRRPSVTFAPSVDEDKARRSSERPRSR